MHTLRPMPNGFRIRQAYLVQIGLSRKTDLFRILGFRITLGLLSWFQPQHPFASVEFLRYPRMWCGCGVVVPVSVLSKKIEKPGNGTVATAIKSVKN